MQSLPLQMKGIFPPAVDLIPQKRVSDAGHMHADLMGAARLQTALDIRIGAEALQHPVMGDGTLSSGADYGHFFPLYGMAPDGRVYPSLIFFQISADNGPVAPRNRMGLQLFCQRIMSAVIFAGNQHSRGILVDSVDDSGAQHSVDAG